MQKRLAVGATLVVLLVTWFMARRHARVAHAANTPNLTLAVPPVAGCALGPAFTFCDQIPGTQSSAAKFVVGNPSAVTNVSASLAAIPGLSANFAAGDFTIVSNTCTGSLNASQGCNVFVAFSPTTSGLRAAALTVKDAGGDSVSANIVGTGKNLTLAPTASSPCLPDNAFTYCAQAIGSASSANVFTLTTGASGAAGVNVALGAIPGLESEFNESQSDFTIDVTTCTGALPPNGSCTISVQFTPKAAGFRTAALTATDSSNDLTAIYLAGQTSGPMQFVGAIVGSPLTCAAVNFFGFCNEPSGGISTANTYTLRNTSGAQITGLTIPTGSTTANSSTPPDFTVKSTTCTSNLDAGSDCTFSVEFTPTATGLRQGAIAVSDASGDIAAVNLAGFSDDYNLALTNSQPLEVTVAAGGTATINAQVIPDNVLGMNGEQMTFVCPTNLPTNTSCEITPCPATLTPGTPTTFSIKFVTSSATSVAPVPTSRCSGYGPQMTPAALVRPGPGTHGPISPLSLARSGHFPALWMLVVFLGLAILVARLGTRWDVGQGRRPLRRRLGLALGCAAATALTLAAGCHHGAAPATPATPPATTDMELQGNALDAQGNPLDASRSLRVILTVTAQ